MLGMKFAVFILAAILLVGCDAKRHKNKKPEPSQCGHHLSHMLAISSEHDIMHFKGLVSCYERNGYNLCHGDMSEEEKEDIMNRCEDEVKGFLGDIASLTGHKQPHWVDELFSKERDARHRSSRSAGTGSTSKGTGSSSTGTSSSSTGTGSSSTGTGSSSTGTRSSSTGTSSSSSLPSVCRDFSSNLVDFFDDLAPIVPKAILKVRYCFSGSRSNLLSCLFDFVVDDILPLLRNNFIRCILSLFRF